MCFLKTLKPLEEISYEKELNSEESSHQSSSKDTQEPCSFLNKLLISHTPLLLNKQDHLLLSLMNLVNSNNLYLQNLDKKLGLNQQLLNKAHQGMNQMKDVHCQPSSNVQHPQSSTGQVFQDQEEETTVNPLISQIFGKKKYQYKLQLQGELPNTIFKERNINISVNLTDLKGEKILNSNIIHLCLGVCDANGQWIAENRAGQNFMKGKTQVEMYHGEGSFLKVYPRDVSRSYPQGKINYVVYSKASMLKFSSNASMMEKIVESSLIEPLLISDISIKAKKKD